jgi:hypothetical protein
MAKSEKPKDANSGTFNILELPKDYNIRTLDINHPDIQEIDRRQLQEARHKYLELRQKANAIEDLPERWKFWRDAKRDYLIEVNMNPVIAQASGEISRHHNDGKGLWLDVFIDTELLAITDEIHLFRESGGNSQEPVNISDTMKVVYLYQTGVLKFLEQRMGATYPDGLDKIVARIIGSSVDSATSALRRLPGQNQEERMVKKNHDTAIGLIRDLKFTMKPFTKIKFDDDELPSKKLRS